jgi:hypothetical protein
MRIYQLFIDDARRRHLSRVALVAKDDERARALARRELDACSHYRGVELWVGGARVLGLGTLRIDPSPPAKAVA